MTAPRLDLQYCSSTCLFTLDCGVETAPRARAGILGHRFVDNFHVPLVVSTHVPADLCMVPALAPTLEAWSNTSIKSLYHSTADTARLGGLVFMQGGHPARAYHARGLLYCCTYRVVALRIPCGTGPMIIEYLYHTISRLSAGQGHATLTFTRQPQQRMELKVS